MRELMNLFSPEIFVSMLPILALIGIAILALLMLLCLVGIVCQCCSRSHCAEQSKFGLLPE